MKIVHLCLEDPYIDNWGYQQNILSEYHAKMGHEVVVLASRWFPPYYDPTEEDLCRPEEYWINNVRIVRMETRFSILNKLKLYKGMLNRLEKEKPDLIFLHTIQSLTLLELAKYVRDHPECRLVADVHSEFNISAHGFLSQKILHGIIWKSIINKTLPYIDTIFCTKPWSVTFIKHYYDIPEEKIRMLYLGVDMGNVRLEQKDKIRIDIRKKFGIKEEDFVLVTGGKLEPNKKITNVFKAVQKLNDLNIHVIVFGKVPKNFKEYEKELIDCANNTNNVHFTGWIKSNEVHDYFFAGDLAVFPGIHSVLWEQAVCSGIPCVFRRWPMMDHVDVGGNSRFLYSDDPEELAQLIQLLKNSPDTLRAMSKIALTKGIEKFSYEKIAKESLK